MDSERTAWWKRGAIFNPILGLLRGRLAGNVFSHNKGGDYVRLGTTPTNPQTSRQQTTRGILGGLASAWSQNLTPAQRDAWDVWASANPIKNSLGIDVTITGLAWFLKCNCRLSDAGLENVVDPPVDPAPVSLQTFSVDISAATTIDVTFTDDMLSDEAFILWTSLPVSVGSTPNLAQCRLAGYSGVGQASPWAATSPHSFQTGQRGVMYGARLDGQGLISAFLQAIDDSDF